MLFGLDFPPVSHLVEWPAIWGSGALAINKVVLEMFLTAVLVIAFFMIAGRRRALVPTGAQNVAEAAIEFVQDGIIMQTMGPDGLRYTPYLLTLFTFILTANLIGLVPGIQMPAMARYATPLFMAVMTYLIYNVVAIVKQGPLKYLRGVMFMPGVPKAMYVLLTPIEFFTVFLIQPFSLSLRLFANLLAGHLILVTFAVLTTALWEATKVGFVLPFALLVALTGFELLVAFLQAYIFTILSAVYIGRAMHPEH
ncbi:MAG: F0F1 ATP synthase subunit A [Actinobacteria bacterium]|nr:F0F1 ATP synthase subunit A [Actinomycetota bacterium]